MLNHISKMERGAYIRLKELGAIKSFSVAEKDEKIEEWQRLTYGILDYISILEMNYIIEWCIKAKANYEYKDKSPFLKSNSIPSKYAGKMKNAITEKINILEVAEMYGLKVKKNKSVCPFHADKDPSLSFSPEKNVFHCFGCGAKGDIIELVRRLKESGYKK